MQPHKTEWDCGRVNLQWWEKQILLKPHVLFDEQFTAGTLSEPSTGRWRRSLSEKDIDCSSAGSPVSNFPEAEVVGIKECS